MDHGYVTLAQAAELTGMKYNTLRAAVVDGLLQFDRFDVPGRPMKPHMVGALTLSRIQCAAHLIRAGVRSQAAWRMAMGDISAAFELSLALGSCIAGLRAEEDASRPNQPLRDLYRRGQELTRA